jgi:biotin carboxyl carrier protein
MKMQNEIVSNKEGVIHEIRVSEGDLVESEDVLVVIRS